MKISKQSSIKNPLRKISLILVMLVLLPTIFYLSLELSSLNEYEHMISGIYEQQLDVILFSVNQYIWDSINSWKMGIEITLGTKQNLINKNELEQILNENASLEYIIVSDTMMIKRNVTMPSEKSHNEKPKKSVDLPSALEVIQRLQRYRSAGYDKIESILLPGAKKSGDEKMVLVSLTRRSQVIFLFVDFPLFVEEIIVPKLEEIAGDRLAIGVFTADNHSPLYQNEDFSFEDAQLYKKLWLFPDYLVGMRMKGKSLEDLARDRFENTLILILTLLFVLVTGAWIIFRNIRNEVKLAQMKSDFVSNVSHELRTPLALIRMYAETLEMGRLRNEDKRMEYYKIINSESERLTRLINNILNFSRIESGKKEYEFQLLSLNEIVQKTIAVYGYHIHNKGFDLKIDLEPEIPDVNLDEEALMECIINILDNAVKYSEQHKYIQLVTGRNEDYVYISVQDRGIGIESKEIDHIFNKFYRASDSMIHNTKGSGLGLTLIKHIMEAHKGKIEVQSKLGEGTTFRLLFPLQS